MADIKTPLLLLNLGLSYF